MTQASVGFQCPDCVRAGRASVRAPQARFGGTRTDSPQLTSIGLIAVNVAVWLGVLLTGGATGWVFSHFALLPQTAGLQHADGHIEIIRGVADGAWWQLGTSVFTHVEVWHIGFNMLALWFLGPMLEMLIGRARFLGVYVVGGLAGSAAVMLLAQTNSQTMGASGAIFGLMGALLVVGTRVGANMSQLWIWLGLNVVITFTAGSSISWQGHLGGLIGGALAAAVIAFAPRQRRTTLQIAGLSLLAAIAVALCVVRALSLG